MNTARKNLKRITGKMSRRGFKIRLPKKKGFKHPLPGK
jgi:hypothetical protein